jgi:NAD(P)-dependent dehydrogenase (short-subunit alcohol dehydrogenase family)
MYTTSSVAPVFIVHRLLHAGLLHAGTKVILVSSEAGSIGLRHEKEGGGNYAHHASKSALNMVGKLLSLDLKDKGIIISLVHPGFMRTEMTKGVGYDKYWDAGGGESRRRSAAFQGNGPSLTARSQLSLPTKPLRQSSSGLMDWTFPRLGSIGHPEDLVSRHLLPEPLDLPGENTLLTWELI